MLWCCPWGSKLSHLAFEMEAVTITTYQNDKEKVHENLLPVVHFKELFKGFEFDIDFNYKYDM